MRIPPVAMALIAVSARAIFSRANGGASVEAFSTVTRRSFTTRSAGPASSHRGETDAKLSGLRRRRAPNSSDTLLALALNFQKKGEYPSFEGGVNSALRATVEDTAEAVDEIVFPQAGKKIDEVTPRMRFAPSPTGSLHVGGARTALYNWLVAKNGQFSDPDGDGAFVLRVEDTDLARSTKESEESVLADLSWLGLNWDEGPDIPLAKYGPYRQSERNEIYSKLADKLIDEGKAYPCFSSKEELEEAKAKQEAAGLQPRYDGTWRDADQELVAKKIADGDEYTIRFKVPAGARVVIDDAVRGTVSWDAESTVGDFILLRSSGVPVYNFCVAVDDASMGITTVIRAEEHLTNTLRQCLILDALGAPRPRFAHCSLILGEDKQKLSKRHGATSCDQFRLDGFLPDAMINYLALLGWNDGTDNEIFTRDELIDAFTIDRIVNSPSMFDMDKLKWVNSQHLKMKSIEEITDLVEEQMEMLGMFHADADSVQMRNIVYAATALAKQMMETTNDAATNAKTVFGYGLPESFDKVEDADEKEMIEHGNFYPIAQILIRDFEADVLPQPDPADPLSVFLEDTNKPIVEDDKSGGTAYSYPKAYKAHMKTMSKELNVKGKNLFHPIRLALTGEMSGQDITRQMSLLQMTSSYEGTIDNESVGVVGMDARMERLKSFCESIPEEFRAPKVEEKNQDGVQDANEAAVTAAANEVAETAVVATDPLDSYEGPPVTALDIRVGRITKVWEHEEADKLYCEEIDIGEDEPRMVASGLRPYMNMEEMNGRLVLVLCNLKARKMVGFPSHGMVLCVSNRDHSEVKFVSPPVDAKLGERITIPGFDFEGDEGQPFAENKIGKKKVFEKLAPFLVTNEYGSPEFLGRPFVSSAGVCTSPIAGGNVS